MLDLVSNTAVKTMGLFDQLYSYGFSGNGRYVTVSLGCFIVAMIGATIFASVESNGETKNFVHGLVAASLYCIYYSFLWPMTIPMTAPIAIAALIIAPIIGIIVLLRYIADLLIKKILDRHVVNTST